ncbi:MAG: caspase family protein [Candidatus Sumerlaeia bacterium]|nr:caspase family protein [Candidatus Sumerlaeia bacterium]
MKDLLSTLIFLLAAVAAMQGQPSRDITLSAGKRLAGVVGVSAYQSVPPLRNTLNDADSIAATLRFLGFEVMTLRDPNKQQLDLFLENYFNRLVKGDYEAALFYYSGHGISVSGNNYLAPVDARRNS